MLKEIFINKTDHKVIQFLRYGVVTAIAGPIDLGGYIYLKADLHVYYVLAATISFTVSLIVNYYISITWVWKARTGKQRRVDAFIFSVIGLIGLGITDLIVWLFTSHAGVNYIISKLIALGIVFFWNFGARHYLFHSKAFLVI